MKFDEYCPHCNTFLGRAVFGLYKCPHCNRKIKQYEPIDEELIDELD